MANRALLVGINEYRDAPLRGCVNDVSDVRELLSAKCNFAASDIRVLLDSDATAANIRRHLQDWVVREAAPADRLLFHFSGHGTQLPGHDGTVHDVVCPFDFDFTEANALSDVDFSAIFKALPAGVGLVWISDSCHSGDLARGRANPSAIPRFLPPPPQIMAQIDALLMRGGAKRSLNGVVERLKGVLIAGCQSHETSADALFDGRYNGALSYYLLKALHRDEALVQDVETVLQNVQGVLSQNGYAQHPQVRGLPELRQKPFLGFQPAGIASSTTAAVANIPPDSDDASVSRVGDGQFWDEDFERAAPFGEASRGDPGWAKVHWAANDEDSTEYRHIADSPLKGMPFEFTPDDLELLIKANAFEPLRERGKIIFALRGAELAVSGAASGDDKFRQVGRAVLNLRDTRPDHQHFRCVIGVYDIPQHRLSAFIGSTVPCRKAVYNYANGASASNMLPAGCYRMAVGTHNGRIGCLMEGEDFTVLRTPKDYVFDTKDTWDDTFPGDDLHPAFANPSAEFSSWGCQTVRGDCPPGTDRFSGEYKEFRQALGLRPGTADHGVKLSYVLLTGLEAATANKLRDGALVQLTRLRHGSRGETVRALQQKLGVAVDGTFGSRLKKTLADYQKKQLGWADGIYGPEMDKLLKFGIFAPAPMVVASAGMPATTGLLVSSGTADARAPDQVKIGTVCHIWDYPAGRCKQRTDVWQVNGSKSAYFLSKLEIDADGAPRAYHPSDVKLPANEAKAFDWLVNLSGSDRHGIQGQNGAVGPAPGFVISATTVTDARYAVNDTRHYVDASSIPYVVLPKGAFPLPAGSTLKNGCVVCVVDTKTGGFTGAIFGDVGRAAGEASIRAAQRLGLAPFNPSHWPKVAGFSGGADDRRFFYLVFPENVVAAPWPVEEIQRQADVLFEGWGGADRLKTIIPGLPELRPPVTVFDETPLPRPRDLDPDEEARAQGRLRSLDVSKDELLDELPRGDLPDDSGTGVDRAPLPGKLEPDPHELSRDAAEVHPDEMDGPGDLPVAAETRATLPKVSWPTSDKEAPCYAHLLPEDGDPQVGTSTFEFSTADLQLLIAANGFKPEGHGDRIVFALRGARLQQKDSFENVDRVPLVEVRPDHRNFNCVIGILNARTGKLSAFKASTVPNVEYITNYYRQMHNLPPFRDTRANMLPTGCYVFRIGTHGGSIYPALRLTDPEKLSEDGKVVVLRTSNDLTYKLDDVWDPCVPYDHVHCAYSYDSFNSAGCLTICGPSTEGPWARFQGVLKTIPRNNRIDLVLLTGREASIAAALRNDGRAGDSTTVQKALGRLRPGSQGEAVRKLQERLGAAVSGYFGWRTKQALTEQQRRANLPCDGIYAPKVDRLLAWDVLGAPTPAPAVVASRNARMASADGPTKLTAEDIRRFAPKALQEYVSALANEGQAELVSFHIGDNPMRLCHFMAQIGHECGGFTIKRETLNYTTTARLRAVWPSRFPDDASARPYLRNEEKLAEKVYGGRLGNVEKGDGFRYRGRGFVQITGRESYREMGSKLQLPLEDNPDLALDPIVAVKVACRTWADKAMTGERGMNELADANKIEALTYRINGGYTNLEDRRAEFRKAWRIWGQGVPPDKASEPEQIERGDRGELVAKLTHSLQDLGYAVGGTFSVFGGKTYAAVCRFQQEHGLRVSGVATPETWEAINRVLGQGGRPARGAQTRESREAQANVPRPREVALVRGIRVFAVALAFFAAVFGLVFLMSLSRPEYFGSLSMWLPLVFAASMFIGAFLIGQWGTAIASSPSYELARARGASKVTKAPADTASEDPEPVRLGPVSPTEG
jgi:predicted chitinase/peptidoglycan hydrolase-like protein with peptidoglycan-binding domain